MFPTKFSLEIRENERTKLYEFRSKFLRISMYFRPHFGEIFVLHIASKKMVGFLKEFLVPPPPRRGRVAYIYVI